MVLEMSLHPKREKNIVYDFSFGVCLDIYVFSIRFLDFVNNFAIPAVHTFTRSFENI